MPRYGRGRGFWGPGSGMRSGFGLGFCRGFQWLPRRWWAGMYGSITPYVSGWMRFGFSPGWAGRSPTGLPPAAQYLMDTGGQLPRFTSYMGQAATESAMPAGMPPVASQLPKEQEVAMLESQAKMLEQQLEQIKKHLEELIK